MCRLAATYWNRDETRKFMRLKMNCVNDEYNYRFCHNSDMRRSRTTMQDALVVVAKSAHDVRIQSDNENS